MTLEKSDVRPSPRGPQGDRIEILAEHVALIVKPSNLVGLGSGSTAEAVVRAIGSRVREGLVIEGVATSRSTELLARTVGIPLVSIDDVVMLDVGIDGADEIDPELNLTKGRGGALLFEKLVARICQQYIVVAGSEKLVEQLGSRTPLPVEVVSFGWRQTAAALHELGLEPKLRMSRKGDDSAPFQTDGGHLILDCQTGPISDPTNLAAQIKAIPGIVEHGLFVGMATRAIIVRQDGRIDELGPASPREKLDSTLVL